MTYSSYEDACARHRWEVPEHFNFGATIDAFGAEPGRLAILCEDHDGTDRLIGLDPPA